MRAPAAWATLAAPGRPMALACSRTASPAPCTSGAAQARPCNSYSLTLSLQHLHDAAPLAPRRPGPVLHS